jgi:hypothetical protein
LTMCYFSIKSGVGRVGRVGWEGKKWFQGLRRLLCSQPKAKIGPYDLRCSKQVIRTLCGWYAATLVNIAIF